MIGLDFCIATVEYGKMVTLLTDWIKDKYHEM